MREVQQELEARRPTGYTTVLKLLQIMTEKGIVERDETRRAHRYSPRVPREQTEQQMVGDLVDRAFGGSASRLVMQALSSRPATAEELERIRTLIDEIEGEKDKCDPVAQEAGCVAAAQRLAEVCASLPKWVLLYSRSDRATCAG